MQKTFPYRFYSHKIKHLSHPGKLFYLKAKINYLYAINPEAIGKFLFNIRCRVICEILLKELTNE
jgi:hypothetical protein